MDIRITDQIALALGGMLATLALSASAMCVDGTIVPCTRNGCPGQQVCIGGHMTGCIVPIACTLPTPHDSISVSKAFGGQEVGIFYDGTDINGAFNDRRAVAKANTSGVAKLDVGFLTTGGFGNSIVAYSRDRAPTIAQQIWTSGVDNSTLALNPPVDFGITFWVLVPGWANLLQQIATAVVGTNGIYSDERTGFRIVVFTSYDVSSKANSALLNPNDASRLSDYKTLVGDTPNEINVYVTATVEGANRAFTWDGSGSTVIAIGALNAHLLAHELGHSFALGHVGDPEFNWQNIMRPDRVREGFHTEGQIFQMHFHPSSMVSARFVPGHITHLCGPPATDVCPALNRRIWPDGLMPPN